MTADESGLRPGSQRSIKKKVLPPGPALDLRNRIYDLYAAAGCPQAQVLAEQIALDDDLPGAPKRDRITEIISGARLATRQDTVSVAVALVRRTSSAGIAKIEIEIEAETRELWIAAKTAEPGSSVQQLGSPVGECDPFALEVHPAIRVPGAGSESALPTYVPRAHDRRLRQLADEMLADGRSRLIVLVAGSSTGKTRASWELAKHLDNLQPGRWRLWHPFDPTLSQAALADLGRVGQGTIVWLNEARRYLMQSDLHLAEQVAAGLRTLLQDSDRGPVLVLATLWPEDWTTLTSRPAADLDLYGQARDLLSIGTMVRVDDKFTPIELAALMEPGGDSQLRYAAEHAKDGRITQYLAGAPVLVDRYRVAPPMARAVVQVAIDARRLGHPLDLSQALLERAAPGYVDDYEWNAPDLGGDWFERALTYATEPCTGAHGLLTRKRLRPGDEEPACWPCYQLADYVEQIGRTERAGVYPPDSLWAAFSTTITEPELLSQLGTQAADRGRKQHAVQLYRQAAARGDRQALENLAWMRYEAGDLAGAAAYAVQAAEQGYGVRLRQLLEALLRAGDGTAVETVARQAADQGDTGWLRSIAQIRQEAGDHVGAEKLLRQAADLGGVALSIEDPDDIEAMPDLDGIRKDDGKYADGAAMLERAAGRGDRRALREIVFQLEETGDHAGAERWAVKAVGFGFVDPVADLASWRGEESGDRADANELCREAIDRADTWTLWEMARTFAGNYDNDRARTAAIRAADRGDMRALNNLAELFRQYGDDALAEELLRLAADRGDIEALRALAHLRLEVGAYGEAQKEAAVLLRQAADLGDPVALFELAELRKDDDEAEAETLYREALDRGCSFALYGLIELQDGDTAAADQMQRFGLTGAGATATTLDFGPTEGAFRGFLVVRQRFD
jgi:TPR repeat protein